MKQNKKKDILFLCQFFYPEYVSSATLPFDTAKRLQQAGYSVGALCGYPKEYSQSRDVPLQETVEGIDIQRLNYLELKRSSFLGRLVNYFSFTFQAFLKMGRCRDYRSIIVYSNPPVLPLVAALAKKRYGCKLIFVAYDIYPEIAITTGSIRAEGMIGKLMRKINRTVFSCVDQVVVLSGEMKDFLVQNRDIAPEKITAIPNWYEDVSEKYAAADPDHPFTKKYAGCFTVSYLGNMGICQDMDTILEACRLMKDESGVRFLFAGHGNKFDHVQQFIREHDLQNVDLYPFLHGEDYLQALSASACSIISLSPGTTGLCCPSKAYGYMMAGNPLLILMDDSDLVRDARQGGFGFQIPNGQPEKLAEAIRQMMADPEMVQNMRRSSLETFRKKYTTSVCTEKYVDLFRKIL